MMQFLKTQVESYHVNVLLCLFYEILCLIIDFFYLVISWKFSTEPAKSFSKVVQYALNNWMCYLFYKPIMIFHGREGESTFAK